MKRNRFTMMPGRVFLAITALFAISGCGDPYARQAEESKAYRAQAEADCTTPDESVPGVPFFKCRYADDFSKSLAAYLARTKRDVQSITASTPDYETTYIVVLK